MKVSKIDVWIIASYFICSLLVIVLSWCFYIYGGSGKNIVSAEGLRYLLKYAIHDFSETSPATLLCLASVYGLMDKSGICLLFFHNHKISLKQRNALGITLFTCACFFILLSLGLFLPHAVLLGVTGHVERSVLSVGRLYLSIIFFFLMGLVYGVASGTFYRLHNIIEGLCSGITMFAPCFISLFLASQGIAAFIYSSLLPDFITGESFQIMKMLVLYIPFLLKLFHPLLMTVYKRL